MSGPDGMRGGAQLRPYTVYLRRRGGCTRGRIDVQAFTVTDAELVAVRQLIEVSYPNTIPENWIVTSVAETVR